MSAQGWCLDMAELHAEHEFPEHHYCKCWRADAPVPAWNRRPLHDELASGAAAAAKVTK